MKARPRRQEAAPPPRSARLAALETLARWQESRLPVDLLLEQQCRDARFADPRDQQLAHAMVYGVLRQKSVLDAIIGRFSKHPLAAMKPLTRMALRLGICQLLLFDRVPPSAAVNETVAAVKKMRQPQWLVSFTNGVLRAVARSGRQVLLDIIKDLPDHEAANMPAWLFERWLARYGRQATLALCRAADQPPPLTLRVNPLRSTPKALLAAMEQAGIEARPGHYAPQAVLLPSFQGPVSSLPGYGEGLFLVQDEAAQLVSLLVTPLRRAGRYLDGCAGLGGKTSHLAALLPEKAALVAVEPHAGRLQKLRENLERLGLGGRVEIVASELAGLSSRAGLFDAILIDAPCSGLGVIRRHPDSRWTRSPEDLRRYRATQLGLLSQAAALLAAGGVLVYATCSIEPEENDSVVAAFLEEHKNFNKTDCGTFLPAAARSLVDADGFLRTLPGRDELDGFFAARLQKT